MWSLAAFSLLICFLHVPQQAWKEGQLGLDSTTFSSWMTPVAPDTLSFSCLICRIGILISIPWQRCGSPQCLVNVDMGSWRHWLLISTPCLTVPALAVGENRVVAGGGGEVLISALSSSSTPATIICSEVAGGAEGGLGLALASWPQLQGDSSWRSGVGSWPGQGG